MNFIQSGAFWDIRRKVHPRGTAGGQTHSGGYVRGWRKEEEGGNLWQGTVWMKKKRRRRREKRRRKKKIVRGEMMLLLLLLRRLLMRPQALGCCSSVGRGGRKNCHALWLAHKTFFLKKTSFSFPHFCFQQYEKFLMEPRRRCNVCGEGGGGGRGTKF